MQVKRIVDHLPTGKFYLFQWEIKQRAVVCLKCKSSICCEEIHIPVQKLHRCQAPSRMTILRPRIRKVQIDIGNLIFFKYIFDCLRIHSDKHQIRKLLDCLLLDCPDKHTRIFLNTDIIDLRMQLCHIYNKSSFSHSHFDMNRIFIFKKIMPLSLHCLFFMHDKIICGNHFSGAFYVS